MESRKGKLNSFYGRKHTEESKNKMRISKLGKTIPEEIRKKMSISHKGIKKTIEDKKGCSERMKQRIIDGTINLKKGKEHWNWKGGVSTLNHRLRTSSMWKIWREAVFLRDNFTCQNNNCIYCNNKIGVMLHPHHIKPFSLFPELRFNINNGVTYCAEFHINSKELHKGILKLNSESGRRINDVSRNHTGRMET